MENSSLCARLLPASASSADRIPSPELLLIGFIAKQSNRIAASSKAD
jgi:hypothetical protein